MTRLQVQRINRLSAKQRDRAFSIIFYLQKSLIIVRSVFVDAWLLTQDKILQTPITISIHNERIKTHRV